MYIRFSKRPEYQFEHFTDAEAMKDGRSGLVESYSSLDTMSYRAEEFVTFISPVEQPTLIFTDDFREDEKIRISGIVLPNAKP